MIYTPRLRLDPLEPEHADALFDGLSDPRLYDWIDDVPPIDVEALRARYQRLTKRCSPDGTQVWLNWAIWLNDEARYTGYIQATIDRNRCATVAYVLFRDSWGHGYGREAVTAMIAHLRNSLMIRVFRACVDSRNRRSISLLRALGFKEKELRPNAVQERHLTAYELEFLLTFEGHCEE